MAINMEIILFLLLVLLSVWKCQGRIYFRFLPYFIIFLFMALRCDYGDGKAYRDMYFVFNASQEELKGIEWLYEDIEPLYVLLNKIMPSFQMVVVITSAMYVFAFYLLISRVLTYKQRMLAILVWVLHPYILMVDMSVMRQAVAISIIMCGVYVANQRSPIYFLPFCGVATLFHKSSIICIIICFLFEKKHFSSKTKIMIFVGTVVFLTIPDKLIQLIEFVLSLTKLDTANYLAYLYSENGSSLPAVVLSLIVLTFFMLCGDAVDGQNAIYIKLSILAVALEALQGRVQQLGRVSMYFLPFFVISLPLLLNKSPQRLQLCLLGKTIALDRVGCILAEACFLFIFVWKFIGFMTPQYAYYTIFDV